jgi:hypothetical protein
LKQEYTGFNTAMNERVTGLEGSYIKQVKITRADGSTQTFTPEGNVIDLSELIIDGGTYA